MKNLRHSRAGGNLEILNKHINIINVAESMDSRLRGNDVSMSLVTELNRYA